MGKYNLYDIFFVFALILALVDSNIYYFGG